MTVEVAPERETPLHRPRYAETLLWPACRRIGRTLTGWPVVFAAQARHGIRAGECVRHRDRNDNDLLFLTPLSPCGGKVVSKFKLLYQNQPPLPVSISSLENSLPLFGFFIARRWINRQSTPINSNPAIPSKTCMSIRPRVKKPSTAIWCHHRAPSERAAFIAAFSCAEGRMGM